MSDTTGELTAAQPDSSPTQAEPTTAPNGSSPMHPDPVALAQLWAGQFQHLGTLGVAGAGGVLILLEAGLLPSHGRWWLVLALLASTALASTYGQVAVVDEATAGRLPGRKPRILRGLSLALLGAAGGALFASFVK